MRASQHNARPAFALPVLLSGLANALLGASSLYWNELGEVPPTTLVAYRIVLSAIMLTFVTLLFKHTKPKIQLTLRLICLHFSASIVIAINWGAFIWSSINGYILECGIGYLLAPFISIALGALIYKDPFNRKRTVSSVIAFSSAVLTTAFIDDLNFWVYLTIATTWGGYTYLKKSTRLDAINGLWVETLFLTGCLAMAIAFLDLSIMPPSEFSARSNQLIWLAGGVSTLPLLMLSYSTGKIPLSTTGLLQFILPATLIVISFIV